MPEGVVAPSTTVLSQNAVISSPMVAPSVIWLAAVTDAVTFPTPPQWRGDRCAALLEHALVGGDGGRIPSEVP